MSDNSLGTSVLELTTDATKLNKGLDDAEKSTKKLESTFTLSNAKMVAAGELLAHGVEKLTEKFFEVTEQAIDYGTELETASRKTGVAVDDMARLKYAAELSETSFEGLTNGLKFLANNMEAAFQGGKNQAQAFDALGISVKGADGQLRPVNDVLMEVADRFSTMPDGTTKSALAMDVFGRAGSALIPMLDEGSAGLRQLGLDAENAGLVIGDKAASASKQLHDQMEQLEHTLTGLAQSFAQLLIPVLIKVVPPIESLVRWTGVILTGAFATVVQGISGFMAGLASLANAVGASGIGASFGSASAATDNFRKKLDESVTSQLAQIGTLRQTSTLIEAQKDALDHHTVKLQENTDELKKQADAAAKSRDELAKLSNFLRGAEDTLKVPIKNLRVETDLLVTSIGMITGTLGMSLPPVMSDLEVLNMALKSNSAMSQKTASDEAAIFVARQKDLQSYTAAINKATDDIKQSAGKIFDDMFIKGENVFTDLNNLLKGGALSLGRTIFEDVSGYLLGPIKKAFDDFFTALLESSGIKGFISGLGQKIGGALSSIIGGGGGGAATYGPSLAQLGAGGASAAGSVASTAASTSMSLGGALIAGGISAAGAIIGSLMQKGNLKRTEENTRETRDWLELQTVAWNPLFFADTQLIQQVADNTHGVGDIIYDAAEGLRQGIFDLMWNVATVLKTSIDTVANAIGSIQLSAPPAGGTETTTGSKTGGTAPSSTSTTAPPPLPVPQVGQWTPFGTRNVAATFAGGLPYQVTPFQPVPSFASGIDRLPFDTPAFLHEGEGVLTKEENASRRSGRATVNNHYYISAVDAQSFDRFFRKTGGPTIKRHLQNNTDGFADAVLGTRSKLGRDFTRQ